MENQNLESIMNMIVYSGDAKSSAMEAIQFAKQNAFADADLKIDAAKKSLLTAHRVQSDLLAEEASGNHIALTLLTVHGQDHLMTSMAFTDLAKEIIDVYRKLDK